MHHRNPTTAATAGPCHQVMVPALAPLAWLLDIPRGERGTLMHGSSVRVDAERVFEGCCAGDASDVTRLADVFGTGAVFRAGTWTLVPPSHTLESIYFLRRANGWLASNSLAFLVARSGVVPPRRADYGATFASLVLGI